MTRLAPLLGCVGVRGMTTGGFAALNHRLMSGNPPGSAAQGWRGRGKYETQNTASGSLLTARSEVAASRAVAPSALVVERLQAAPAMRTVPAGTSRRRRNFGWLASRRSLGRSRRRDGRHVRPCQPSISRRASLASTRRGRRQHVAVPKLWLAACLSDDHCSAHSLRYVGNARDDENWLHCGWPPTRAIRLRQYYGFGATLVPDTVLTRTVVSRRIEMPGLFGPRYLLPCTTYRSGFGPADKRGPDHAQPLCFAKTDKSESTSPSTNSRPSGSE